MGRLILVRHGESTGNRSRTYAKVPEELPLTERGYEQAHAAARRIKTSFDTALVATSPYLRARETARIIAEGLQVPLEIETQLYEREMGVYRGETYGSYSSAPDFDARRPWVWRPEGGESLEDVQARVSPVVYRLAAMHAASDVVVVSHGGVMLTLWALAARDWAGARAPSNCGIFVVEHGPDGLSAAVSIDPNALAQDVGG
jgi:broad specificity phosphatase PhoE